MPLKINQAVQEFNSFFADLKKRLSGIVQQEIEKCLEADVSAWLYRGHHERRCGLKQHSQAQCQRCGSQNAARFMRNGHRQRQMVTTYGVIQFWLPRVVCDCGGSVKIPFSILQPYQQIWEDVLQQVSRWANLGLSLRQMQSEIAESMGTQIGLRTLNEQVQALETPVAIELRSVPPVVMLDAIYLSLLEETGDIEMDALGRARQVKVAKKVCVLVALGLYPQTGRWGILGWEIAESEEQAEWERLLVPLETRGLYRQRGLELFIHDGNSGLIAALNFLYPNIPHQRCAFHKLRNLWQAIQPPDELSAKEKRQFKRQIIQQATQIFHADNVAQAQQIRDKIISDYADTQAKFVATLERDWQDTVAFYRVLKQFPNWPRKTLRTTSLLERINRMLRRLFRPKDAFHSLTSLLATVARVLNPKRLI